jgi:hypothetical protein
VSGAAKISGNTSRGNVTKKKKQEPLSNDPNVIVKSKKCTDCGERCPDKVLKEMLEHWVYPKICGICREPIKILARPIHGSVGWHGTCWRLDTEYVSALEISVSSKRGTGSTVMMVHNKCYGKVFRSKW